MSRNAHNVPIDMTDKRAADPPESERAAGKPEFAPGKGLDVGTANLLAAHKRAANILRIEEKKGGVSYVGMPDESVFTEDAERKLFAALNDAGAAGSKLAAEEKFEDAMAQLAKLRGPLDTFFDDVMVNADDKTVRENRLKLLSQIISVMGEIADFSKIEG